MAFIDKIRNSSSSFEAALQLYQNNIHAVVLQTTEFNFCAGIGDVKHASRDTFEFRFWPDLKMTKQLIKRCLNLQRSKTYA